MRAAINPTKTVLQPIDRGVDFVGQVIKPWRRVLRGRMLPSAIQRVAAAEDAESRRSSANSYLGLMRQCSAFRERADIARLMLRHGHPVDAKLTRAFAHAGDL